MRRMKQGFSLSKIGGRLLVSLISVFLTVLLLEVGLRLFVPVSDMPVVLFDPEVGVHLAPEQSGVKAIGAAGQIKGWYHINAEGWNSLHEYSEQKDPGTLRIAVIGDSYVEALQVDVDKAFPALLEHLLQSDPACTNYNRVEVYSFGYSGAPLSQYLSMMRYVSSHYNPDVFVINMIINDFDESLEAYTVHRHFLRFRPGNQGGFEEIRPEPYTPSPLRRFLLNSALVRYIYYNLDAPSILASISSGPGKQPVIGDIPPADQALIPDLTALIFGKYRRISEANDAGLLLVMDADRQAIYSGQPPRLGHARYAEIASQTAARLGIASVDLTSAFTDDYRQQWRDV
ncbi:MAG: SGNH/GDSL hydrolase family protein [Anaerolineae bacterium]|nr:SGNH/GDSL hydrolase family protein [Anaerolineae bacterium]